jgi:7,8-dihydro-6-hydroxymethylpterin-pyrophosphokinase
MGQIINLKLIQIMTQANTIDMDFLIIGKGVTKTETRKLPIPHNADPSVLAKIVKIYREAIETAYFKKDLIVSVYPVSKLLEL